MKNKILLLGIGNAILGDEAVGIKIGEYFEQLALPIDVEYAGLTGLRILDYIQGYEVVIIVDALEINYENVTEYKVRLLNLGLFLMFFLRQLKFWPLRFLINANIVQNYLHRLKNY